MSRQFTKRTNEIVDKLCPMDDTFFRLLAEDVGFCEEVIRTILEMPLLKVIKTEPQKVLHNFNGRSVIVDVLCEDEAGNLINIEIQKEDNDDHVKRVRYNAANMDTAMSRKGTEFGELKDIYIIYISRFDVFAGNKTMYHVDKRIRETGELLDDGVHTVFVNTKVNDGTNVAELMSIFKSSVVPDNKSFPKVCTAVKGYKIGKGRDTMCTLVEDYAKEAKQEGIQEVVKKLLLSGVSDDVIKQASGLTQSQIDQLRSEM